MQPGVRRRGEPPWLLVFRCAGFGVWGVQASASGLHCRRALPLPLMPPHSARPSAAPEGSGLQGALCYTCYQYANRTGAFARSARTGGARPARESGPPSTLWDRVRASRACAQQPARSEACPLPSCPAGTSCAAPAPTPPAGLRRETSGIRRRTMACRALCAAGATHLSPEPAPSQTARRELRSRAGAPRAAAGGRPAHAARAACTALPLALQPLTSG